MTWLRKRLYAAFMNAAAAVAPGYVREVHNEVLERGMKAYADARRVNVPDRFTKTDNQ